MPPSDVKLLKLIWHPDDTRGEHVMPAAFKRKELAKDPEMHVSVDRLDLAERAIMEETADRQKAKANGKDILRDDRRIGVMLCGDVRAICVDGQQILTVASIPENGNDAHCGISNNVLDFKGVEGRNNFDELRLKLASLASPHICFDTAYNR